MAEGGRSLRYNVKRTRSSIRTLDDEFYCGGSRHMLLHVGLRSPRRRVIEDEHLIIFASRELL